MARTKAVLGAGARLSDYLSASLLARVYPVELIEQILDEHGVNSQRIRSLPATVMAYYCMALSLYPEAAYAEVYSVIAHGLAWTRSGVAVPAVAKSSISAARGKLGSAPRSKHCIDASASHWPTPSGIPMPSTPDYAWSPLRAATSRWPMNPIPPPPLATPAAEPATPPTRKPSAPCSWSAPAMPFLAPIWAHTARPSGPSANPCCRM